MPFQGVYILSIYIGRCPMLCACWPFRPSLPNLEGAPAVGTSNGILGERTRCKELLYVCPYKRQEDGAHYMSNGGAQYPRPSRGGAGVGSVTY